MILIATTTLLVNCSKDDSTPAAKKYLISKMTYPYGTVAQFSYNAQNNITKIQWTDSSGNFYWDFIYNSNAVLTEIKGYDSSVLSYRCTIEMNSDKTPSKVIGYNDNDTTTTAFEYDASKNLTKISYYHGGLVLPAQNYSNELLTYNTAGNVTRTVFNDIPGGISYQCDYEYDTKNSPYYQEGLKWPWFIIGGDDSNDKTNDLLKNNPVKKTQTIPNAQTTNYSYEYNTDGYPTKITEGTNITNIEYIVK